VFKIKIGKKGEEIACRFLKKNGYKIIARNFRKKIGEIDIIAEKGDTIIFVEVKTRKNTKFGLPQEYVNKSKIDKMVKTASMFLTENSMWDRPVRFDVIGISLENEEIKIEHEQDCVQIGDFVSCGDPNWQPW